MREGVQTGASSRGGEEEEGKGSEHTDLLFSVSTAKGEWPRSPVLLRLLSKMKKLPFLSSKEKHRGSFFITQLGRHTRSTEDLTELFFSFSSKKEDGRSVAFASLRTLFLFSWRECTHFERFPRAFCAFHCSEKIEKPRGIRKSKNSFNPAILGTYNKVLRFRT